MRITKPISVSLPPELLKWLDAHATSTGQSRTAIVCEGIKRVRSKFEATSDNWETKLRRYNETTRRRPRKEKK